MVSVNSGLLVLLFVLKAYAIMILPLLVSVNRKPKKEFHLLTIFRVIFCIAALQYSIEIDNFSFLFFRDGSITLQSESSAHAIVTLPWKHLFKRVKYF